MTKDHIWRGCIDPPGHCQGWAIKEPVSGERVGALSQVDSLDPRGSQLR